MIAAARKFVDGDIDFPEFRGPVLECQNYIKRVKTIDPSLQQLATEWAGYIERTWNEWGISPEPMSVKELRDRISADLGDK